MGILLRFPRPVRHVRASQRSFAAKLAKISAVTPADLARSVDKMRDHQSEGMLSRRHHLITAQLPAPTSEAIASLEGHSSTIDRKEPGKSAMHRFMGHAVPKIKAIVSHDIAASPGHLVPMAKDDDTIAESEWREAFRERIRIAQATRTQETMARLLGISRDTYAKYVGSRASVMSPRLLLRFCEICNVKIEWLIEGREADAPEWLVKIPARPTKIASRR